MAMKSVTLDEAKWSSVMTILGNSTGFSWAVTNPLLMEIGAQLQPAPVPMAEPEILGRRPNGPDHEEDVEEALRRSARR